MLTIDPKIANLENEKLKILNEKEEKEIQVHKKQSEIEELNKKIREMEFNYKQEIKKLQTEITQKSFFEDKLSKTSDPTIMKIAKELENKLSNKENEVMELKKNEFKLREQINLLKKNNNEEKKRSDSINLKPKPSRFGACSISKKTDDTLENIEEENEGNENFNKKNFSRSQTFVPLKMDSSLKKGYTNTNKSNTNNQNYSFIEEYIKELKSEIKNLENSISQLKESAVETLVDKEKELMELRINMDEQENHYKDQIDLLTNNIQFLNEKINTQNSTSSNTLLEQINILEKELDRINNLYYETILEKEKERETFIESLDIANTNLEQQKFNYESTLKRLENDMDYMVFQKISETTESSKQNEQKYIEIIQNLDEKLRISEKINSEFNLEIINKEKSFFSERKEYLKEIDILNKKLKEKNKIEEKYKELENKFEEEKKNYDDDIKKKIEKIYSLESSKNALNKRLMTYGTEFKVIEMKYDSLHKSYDELKFSNEELLEKFEAQTKKFQLEINELSKNYENTISLLNDEIEKLQNSHDYKNPGNECASPSSNLIESKNRISSLVNNENQLNEIAYKFVNLFDHENNESEITKNLTSELNLLEKENFNIRLENLNLHSRIEDLLNEIQNLNLSNSQNINLNSEIDEYKIEIKNFQIEIEKLMSEMQKLRNELLDLKTEKSSNKEYISQIESYKKEKEFLIEEIIKIKEEMANNYNFFNEELEKSRKEAIEYKINYSQVLMEKEYYLSKFNKITNFAKIV